MMTRRTWVLLGATAIAFVVSLVYWEQRPMPSQTAIWNMNELGAAPDVEWATVGSSCAVALGVSLLIDFIGKGRKRT
jgi:hypothetical protein